MKGPTSTLAEDARAELDELTRANLRQAARFPGDRADRQPVHVVYGGAQLFRVDTIEKVGRLARKSLDDHAPDAASFARALALPGHQRLSDDALARFVADEAALRAADPELWLPLAVYDRVRKKLEREPVEDYRIDFEDGFGVRPSDEEDRLAVSTAQEAARAYREKRLSPFFGVRIKPLNEELRLRAIRTLELFVTTLVTENGGALPEGFVVTLPKITVPEQPRALVRLFEKLEARLALPKGALKLEMMIELTQAILAADGRSNLPLLLDACEGRCTGAHFGSYDYTASADVTSSEQTMSHPAALFALQMMKTAFAQTGVFLSDGATNVLPIGDTKTVHAAWRSMLANVTGSLKNGFYQGWDLHPAQVPVRYAASYAFFLAGFAPAAARLSNFVEKAAQATLVGDVFDDAATGQGLLNYFLRGVSSGAVTEAELAATGLDSGEIRTRSFTRIVRGRTNR